MDYLQACEIIVPINYINYELFLYICRAGTDENLQH